MKEIRAYVQPHKLSQITMALLEIPGFPGMSIMDCEGFGRERTEHSQDYKPFLLKKRLEIFAPDDLVEIIFETIMRTAHSGHHGDGKVYILDVLEGGRVSSGERDKDLG
ncbi:P-II family nitrogen regulator [Methylomonas sp. LW13]|uniref:P-II family nitrogen regulator n=1 Tax=Methylomonas defluvii TaxID=3045149 RepID=A0ABU4UCL4_9GAMM|nr:MULTISPECIES: P-II family nitrogen regulator [unclassified Methylomonas]MDX8127207.1 P-II family nitrogen regulator [Methylomonas sp. OY6]PKD40019.1 P-II family nitrogen regulator [Methylomonas sp. Kb3]QBC26527.1 P-II family nitrogen regulator [Methylomonas sp. LW13]